MKEILEFLFTHQTLNYQTAKSTMLKVISGEYHEHEIASFLSVFRMRPITTDEICGFKDALLEKSISVKFDEKTFTDVVGTGGDGKNTLNISTLTCFVLASMDYKVAKHGNYAASSISGSSDILEYFGYKFSNNREKLQKEITSLGLTFLHAPLFHPALKSLSPIRKNIKFRTIFNLIGPLVNPSFPSHSLVGVSDLKFFRLYKNLFQKEKKNYALVHSTDGYDEISLTSDFHFFNRDIEKIFNPRSLKLPYVSPTEIFGGKDIQTSAKIFLNILKNVASSNQKNVILVNAAFATLNIEQSTKSFEECFEKARENLESGKTYEVFKKTMNTQ